MGDQEQEWKALYAELLAVLSTHGTEDPVGDGDFWLVDDNYGSPQHKVCVSRVPFITQPLCREVQRVIRKYSLAWEVLFSLDFTDERRHEGDLGLTVTKARIEECWNVERMAKTYGADFRWKLSLK